MRTPSAPDRAQAPPGRRSDPLGGGSASLLWAQVLGNAGLFAGVVLLARSLGPSGRGTLAFLTMTAIVSATVARLGVTEATTVFCAQRRPLRATLLTNQLLAVTGAALVSALVVCGGLWLAPGVRPGGIGHAELVVLALGMFASGLVDAGYAFVLGCQRFRFHAAVTISMAWLYAGSLAVVEVAVGLGVLSAALVWVGVQVVKASVLLGAAVRAEGFGRWDPALLRESVSFGLRAWIGTLSTAFNERLDQILVALLASEAVLGIYATGVNAFEVLLYPAAAASTAILPLAARAGAGDRTERVLAAFRAIGMLTLFGVLCAALLGPLLIPLAFGDAFEPSRVPFLWLLPGALGFVALSMFSNALVAASAPGRSSAGPLVSLVLMVLLDVLLIPSLGATGAALASSAGLVSGGALALALFRRHAAFPVRDLVRPRREDLVLLRALARPFRRQPPAQASATPSSTGSLPASAGVSTRRISSR